MTLESSGNNDPFKDIRPYHDSEVSDVLFKLLKDAEFTRTITNYQFPKASQYFGWLLEPLVKINLARKTGDIASVYDFQMQIADFMARMMSRTTTRLTLSGIDQLDPEESYLFISNHRDIALDPAFVNWALYQNGHQTVRIAIGDNLLTKPFVSDLMRLNKSFIVKRSTGGPKEMAASLNQLSKYITHSINNDHSIWIAQQEGRAKDGNDKTDPAILKMFYMSQRKHYPFEELARRLRIIPVSISYEFDPCDYLKAEEIFTKRQTGGYEKAEHEDIASIVRGIEGSKGHVHVAFGDLIEGDFDTPEALAQEIDRQIYSNYHLHPVNYCAANLDDKVAQKDRDDFAVRLARTREECQDILREMYANPLINKQKALGEG